MFQFLLSLAIFFLVSGEALGQSSPSLKSATNQQLLQELSQRLSKAPSTPPPNPSPSQPSDIAIVTFSCGITNMEITTVLSRSGREQDKGVFAQNCKKNVSLLNRTKGGVVSRPIRVAYCSISRLHTLLVMPNGDINDLSSHSVAGSCQKAADDINSGG